MVGATTCSWQSAALASRALGFRARLPNTDLLGGHGLGEMNGWPAACGRSLFCGNEQFGCRCLEVVRKRK